MADPDYHAAIRKGYEWGVQEERERILVLWDIEMGCDCEEAMRHLRERIKGGNE